MGTDDESSSSCSLLPLPSAALHRLSVGSAWGHERGGGRSRSCIKSTLIPCQNRFFCFALVLFVSRLDILEVSMRSFAIWTVSVSSAEASSTPIKMSPLNTLVKAPAHSSASRSTIAASTPKNQRATHHQPDPYATFYSTDLPA